MIERSSDPPRLLRSQANPDFARSMADGADSPRSRAIELIAYGITSAADVAQLMTDANPLTTNYVQWLTLARRIAIEANARSATVTDVLIESLESNQQVLNRGWDLLVGHEAEEKHDDRL